MSQVIVFNNGNGGMATCIPTGEISIEAVMEKDVPKGRNARIINASDMPRDVDFYDAFELTPTEIVVNLAKAKEITKNRLRAERKPLLEAQDVLFMRATEQGADTTAIVAEKNRLRDITKLADSANSLEELRALKAGV